VPRTPGPDSSGFPIGSSLSKSAANDRAGAHTPASLVVAAAATALVALLLTPLFEPLPEATLGAVVVVAVSGMMKVGKMRRLWILRRIDFWMAMIALVGVLVVPTLEALAVAVTVSLVLVVWRASEARFTLLGRPQGQLEPVELGTDPDDIIPGLLIVRPDEMLFFANASPVRDGILTAVSGREPRPDVVLVDLSLTPDIDVPAIEMLEDLHDRLTADGIELWLAYVRPRVLELLDRAGVLATLGPDAVQPQLIDAVVAFLRRAPGSTDRIAVLRDVITYVRERRAQQGISPASAAMLGGLEHRLSRELDAAGDTLMTAREDGEGASPAAPTPG
jgi:SulP family sulfate permease